ncbi:hypothetical protein BMS3Bbin04_01350 [bacterium BMS3Bbin04]|nr:hypothetical protein BMS3Bbin04_01350 [bacterium BMS3Bbin04]
MSYATPGSTWLELGPGARSAGLAEAMTASASGATANYWNPAGVGLYGNSMEAMYADSWVEGTSIQYVAGAFDLGRFGFGASAHYVGVGDLDLRDRPSASPIGTFDARNTSLGLSLASDLAWGIRAGVGAHYLDEQIYVYEAQGWTIDLGLLRSGLWQDRIDVGVVARHLGDMGTLRRVSEDLPATVAAGVRYRPGIYGEFRPALLVDVSKVRGYDPTVKVAAEINVMGYLALRAGYTTGYEARGLSAGFGVMFKGIRFDFAYVPQLSDLGTETRYSVGGEW